MSRKALETVHRYEMFSIGDQVVAGVSGGADSMALLDFLCTGPLKLQVTVCHINHLLRGKESDRDEDFVRRLCRRYGVPCRVLRCDIAALARQKKQGLEECARKIRYDFFEQTAKKLGENVRIATAHTLSDRVETMLFHLARGTAAGGFTSIPPVRGRIVRPLIDCTRAEVERYCAARRIPYVTDSTNRDPRFSRNRLRLKVIPELRQINSGFEQNARRLMEDIREDHAYLNELAKRAVLKARQGVLEDGVLAEELAKLPLPVKKRAAAMVLEAWNCEKSAAQIGRFCQIIRGKSGTLNLSGRRTAVLTEGVLAPRQALEPYFEFPLTDGEHDLPGGWRVIVQTLDKENFLRFQKIHKNRFHYLFDCDKIMNNFVLRQKLPGDVITLYRRNVTKSIKKLLGEQKLTAVQKSRVPVIADEMGPLAVGCYGMSVRAAADETTSRFLAVTVEGPGI